MHQSAHDAFVRLETRGGHVYHRREEDVEQEGREHAPLAKALFHSEPPPAHPVVEPHACSHAIVELTNDRDHNLWHAKTGEYCPEEGSINGVVYSYTNSKSIDQPGKVANPARGQLNRKNEYFPVRVRA